MSSGSSDDLFDECHRTLSEMTQRLDNIANILENAIDGLNSHRISTSVETENADVVEYDAEGFDDPRELPRPIMVTNRIRRSPAMASLWGDDVTEEGRKMLEQTFSVPPHWESRSWVNIKARLQPYAQVQP